MKIRVVLLAVLVILFAQPTFANIFGTKAAAMVRTVNWYYSYPWGPVMIATGKLTMPFSGPYEALDSGIIIRYKFTSWGTPSMSASSYAGAVAGPTTTVTVSANDTFSAFGYFYLVYFLLYANTQTIDNSFGPSVMIGRYI